jgi:hypothetical protein
MIIKAIGLIIFMSGFVLTLYTGLDFVSKEKVADVGSYQVTKNNDRTTGWSPLFGIGAMIIGGVVFISGNKKHFRPSAN